MGILVAGLVLVEVWVVGIVDMVGCDGEVGDVC